MQGVENVSVNGKNIAVIICAAGSSKRMGGKKKEYLPLPGGTPPSPTEKPLTVLGAALSAFASCPEIGHIVITVPPDEGTEEVITCLPAELNGASNITFVPGGQTRRSSVHNALSALKSYKPSHVLIHDGARPWIKRHLIENIIEAAIKYGAVIPALPLVETPKELSSKEPEFTAEFADGAFSGTKFIKRHLRREELCAAQTPQGFAFAEILKAHEKASEREKTDNFEYTDDAEVWGEFVGLVAVIPGDPANKKITFPEDLY